MTKLLTLALSTAALCGACASETSSDTTAELMSLYEVRDFFSLDEQLDERPDLEPRFAAFFRAATEHAFNEPEASNATLESVLRDDSLPADLALKAWEIRLANDLRLGRYAEALEATETARALGGVDVTLEDVDVYTGSIVDEKDDFLLCNAGLDLLAPFESYSLNFRSMSVEVRE